MSAFWLIAALFVLGALASVLPPLLSRRERHGPTAEATNALALRASLAEIDADYAAGALAREQWEDARREVQRRVLEEVPAHDARPAAGGGRRAAALLAVLLPAAVFGLYLHLGSPDSIDARPAPGHAAANADFERLATNLAERLAATPADADGWIMLARTQMALERHDAAAAAYARAAALRPRDAELLGDYADALARAQGGLAGEPERIIARALEADPENLSALALSGSAAFERGDYAGAVRAWEKLQGRLPEGSEPALALRERLREARQLGNLPAPPPAADAAAPMAAISGTVRIAPVLADRAAPEDTVFVFARPETGSRMPLALTRLRVRDLPAAFRLDESTAMGGGAGTSGAGRVVVVARVSKSGDAAPASGDLEGTSAPVAPGSSDVIVDVSRVIP
ncbi:MAG: c-type cytochrome biogenesis protein CcmI [Gammaproteobacteria bacterium]